MPEKTKKKTEEPIQEKEKEKEIVFVCKFCGETKPLSELVIIRHYYPLVSSCKNCSKMTKNST